MIGAGLLDAERSQIGGKVPRHSRRTVLTSRQQAAIALRRTAATRFDPNHEQNLQAAGEVNPL
jgi:hypothetical protein